MPISPSPEPQAARVPATRRWRRRGLKALAVLVVLLLLAPLLVRLGPVRGMIEDAVGETLGRRVEIESSSAYWGAGIDLEGITVHSPEGFDGPLATIARVHLDVDVLSLLFGSVSAKARVISPHVTLRVDAAGRGNEDGVVENVQGDAKEEDDDGDAAFSLIVIGGRFETPARESVPANVIDEVQVTLSVLPGGSKLANVEAVIAGAAVGGDDARVKLDADLDATGAGVVMCEAPPLDLKSVAQLVESVTGIRDLKGTVELRAKATVHADETIDGLITFRAERLSATTPEDARFSIRRVDARTELRSVQHATDAQVQVKVGDVRVERVSADERVSFREPSVTVMAAGRYEPRGGLLRVASAHVAGGATITGSTEGPVRIETDPVLRMKGKAGLRVDLQRLGELRALVPALEPLAGGVLAANLEGRGGRGVDLGAGISVTSLRLRETSYAPEGYADAKILLTCNVRSSKAEGTRVVLHRLESAVLQASFPKERGLAVTLDPLGRLAVDGTYHLRVDLPALSRLAGGALGLERGERIGGEVSVRGTGRGDETQMRLDSTVHARGLVLPPSLGDMRTPATLRATLRMERGGEETECTLTGLEGMGLSGEGSAILAHGEEGARLDRAAAEVGIDLAAARVWLGALLGLPPGHRLGGRVRSSLQAQDADGGRRLLAKAHLDELIWERGEGTVPVTEKQVTLDADVALAPEGGRHRAEDLRLQAGGISLDLSGATYVAEPDADVDVTIRLGGDAARLAPLASALLGEGYEDLRGLGAMSGEMTLRGSTAHNGASLLANGSLHLGSWNTGGLDLAELTVSSKRRHPADVLAASLRAGMNTGMVRVDTRLRLGAEAVAWGADVAVDKVDTSGVLLSRGFGRYLAFALPALLPAGVSTPVLSGLLDAHVKLNAPSVEDPALSDGLAGSGRLQMAGGEIRQSTLFPSGGKFGQVTQVLKLAAPAAGAVLEGLSKAVAFSSLDSRFRVGGRVVTVEQAKLVGSSVHIDMRGTVTFAQRVSLETDLVLQGGGGRAVGAYLPGGVIPLRVSGTLEKPKVTPNVDLAKLAAGGAGSRLRDALKELDKKKLPGGIKNPFK